jgi:hypothetical protein
MPKVCPIARRDVMAVARKGEDPLSQVATASDVAAESSHRGALGRGQS